MFFSELTIKPVCGYEYSALLLKESEGQQHIILLIISCRLGTSHSYIITWMSSQKVQ